MTGGIAGVGVSAFMMVLAKVQEKFTPVAPPAATEGVGATRHELYNATDALNEAMGEISSLSKDVISPSMGAIDNIGSGIF
jgi:hypothetical protein